MSDNTIIGSYGNNWQGRQGKELFEHLDMQTGFCDIIFGSEVEAQMSGDLILGARAPVYVGKHDGRVMVNQANVIKTRYDSHYNVEYAGENERSYNCATTGETFDNIQYGNIMMVSKQIECLATGHEFVFGTFSHSKIISASPRVLQYAVLVRDGKRVIFAHFHGLWINGNTKGDCPERDLQSSNILSVLGTLRKTYECDRVVLGGDFNLDITTRALAQLETGLPQMPFRNGVREAGFTGTRTPHYRHYHDPAHSNFADFLLYGGALDLLSLKLGADKASDHHSLNFTIRLR